MPQEDLEQLAATVVDNQPLATFKACIADPALAGPLSRAVAALLIDRAANHHFSTGRSAYVWPTAQSAIVALAALPGADGAILADALLRCCVYETVPGEPDQLDEASFRLIVEHHADTVRRLLEHEDDEVSLPWPTWSMASSRFLTGAVWSLPGADGVRWTHLLLTHQPSALHPGRPRSWTAEDWVLHLDSLSERAELRRQAYRLIYAPVDEAAPPPREASAALVRYCSTHFTREYDVKHRLGRAARIIDSYRTGDPTRDVTLFWWEPRSEDQIAALRWLLELSAPAGERVRLIEAAQAAGIVTGELAQALAIPLDRPLWADRDVPWLVTEVVEAGILAFTSDTAVRPGAAMPDELVGWSLPLEAGRHAVRVVVAVHPVHGRADAAIEVVVDAHAEARRWELVTDPTPDAHALWVARDGMRAVRAVLDLGRLDLDLATEPPPWFVHDRLPRDVADREPAPEDAPELTIGADELRALAELGAPLDEQRAALRTALHQRGVSEYSSALVLRHTRDAVVLFEDPCPGRSRLGGDGLLPAGSPWPQLSDGEPPRHLACLVVLALDELPSLAPLPTDGTLIIFQETEMWGLSHDPLAATRVLYVPEGGELVEPATPEHVLFPLKSKPLRGLAMPVSGASDVVVEALEFVDDQELVIEAMNELTTAWHAEHWLLGASLEVQGPPHLELPRVLEALDDEHRTLFSDAEREGRGWMLLAQINEDLVADFGIGDGGSFYLFIPEADLPQRRFDRVVGLMQCH